MLNCLKSVDDLRLPVTNGSAMVFRLPNELLGQIVKALPPPKFAGNRFDGASYPAFSLSHTCKEWREVAMAYPECWRYIPCTNSHWLDEGLRRSEGALLHLYIDVSTVYGLQLTVHRLSSHVSRVYAITMDDFTHAALPVRYVNNTSSVVIVMSLLKLDFPMLKDAALLQWHSPPAYSHVPATVFAGQAPPVLEHLVLNNITLSPSSQLFKAPLRRLEITTISNIWFSTESIKTFFNALSRLEVLTARQDPNTKSSHWPPDILQSPRCIEAPLLHEFTFVGLTHDAIEALKLLVLPMHCNIHIEELIPPLDMFLYDAHRWSTPLHDKLDVLSMHLATVPTDAMMHASSHVSLSYRSVEIYHDKFVMQVKLNICFEPDLASSRVTSFELIFYLGDERMGASFHIRTFCERLAPHLIANAHTLRLELLNPDHYDPQNELWDVLAAMPFVRTLTLVGRAGEMLFEHEALNRSLCEVLADLRTLTLSRLDFGTSLTAEELAMAVQASEGRSWNLEALRLVGCTGLSPKDLDDLHMLEGVAIEAVMSVH